MKVNNIVAEALYDCHISIGSKWVFVKYIQDIIPDMSELDPDYDDCSEHKKGEIGLFEDCGNNNCWYNTNKTHQYCKYFCCPDAMDVRDFFEKQEIHMSVELNLINNIIYYKPIVIYKNADGNYKTVFGKLYEKDYETVFNYALLKCVDIYAKVNNIEINLFSNNENKS